MSRRSENSALVEFQPELTMATEAEVLTQHSFRRRIVVERKRSERSKEGVLLVLIDAGKRADHGSKGGMRVSDQIIEAMLPTLRDTDVIGWYEEGSVVGMLLTEIDRTLRNTAISSILQRVNGALAEQLTFEQVSQISISFYLFPDEWDENRLGHDKNPRFYPDLTTREKTRRGHLRVKRAMDMLGSCFALLVSAPMFAIIAVAIRMTSEGPIFFRQKRVGRDGREFTLYKFRTMRANNDSSQHREYMAKLIAGVAEKVPADGKAGVYKLANDNRITPIGKILRKTSMDELPQFLNVLKGDMSLVGPRPGIAYEVAAYKPWHRRRILQVKPGITGLWQVTARSQVGFDEMVRLDLRYAEDWSPWLDFKILMQTPRAVVKGAY
ncbi:sugar transferase [Occallatibacter riparius]|uniref:Sugar transferase n=1 Tax=Occallatibacter riparius TaxID=1002689 RepID=A0A9J7BRQ1_9BACT|nr:sugar transferase [Occallatibacter riparius]UWZ83725.1 sugar transferase [Occallatibacter riparius]